MMKVLIVENHPDMRELLIRAVERVGFRTVAAKNGKEGIQKALQAKPSRLILIEVRMPDMDGRDVVRTLRSHPETRETPILAATALFREPDLQSCIEAGSIGYLVKPFTFRQLLEKVQEYISPPLVEKRAEAEPYAEISRPHTSVIFLRER